MTDRFELYDGHTKVVRSLKDEPVFMAAVKLAMEMMHTGPRSLFEPAATWSAELKAVNAALRAGHPLTGAQLEPPVLGRLEAPRWDKAE
jgi:hypothetical protein